MEFETGFLTEIGTTKGLQKFGGLTLLCLEFVKTMIVLLKHFQLG